jgi:transcriptional regulator with XRE-family HTH domain
MQDDMARQGWLTVDLARRARVSHMTVARFLQRRVQTPRTAKKLAKALGFSVTRYFIPSRPSTVSAHDASTVTTSDRGELA